MATVSATRTNGRSNLHHASGRDHPEHGVEVRVLGVNGQVQGVGQRLVAVRHDFVALLLAGFYLVKSKKTLGT
jgi:hypothetical protein